MLKLVSKLQSRKGQTLVEYGLLLALIAVVVITVLTTMGGQVDAIFEKVSTALTPGT